MGKKLKDFSMLRVVLYEGVGSEALESELRYEVVARLLDEGYEVTRMGEGEGVLDGAGGSGDGNSGGKAFLVLGDFGEKDVDGVGEREGVSLINVRGLDGSGILKVVEERRGAQGGEEETVINRPGSAEKWKPWFPVIDYDRCTNCMQCLSFCLFDVYGVDDESRIQVQNHDNCKTNCPACSRVCPEVAIMFPKYKAEPINGDVVSEQDVQREKMKVDISSLLGGDVYAKLRERSEKAKSRFSKERDSEKALKERQRCLTKLVSEGDIPPEVLAALPSQEEIQKKAVAAKEKAERAQEAAEKQGSNGRNGFHQPGSN